MRRTAQTQLLSSIAAACLDKFPDENLACVAPFAPMEPSHISKITLQDAA